MTRSSPYDYRDAYIHVKRTIRTPKHGRYSADVNNTNTNKK